ncbi:uncharacterized protein ACB058_009474 isoform 2-T2 [Synchiropus picturatus]
MEEHGDSSCQQGFLPLFLFISQGSMWLQTENIFELGKVFHVLIPPPTAGRKHLACGIQDERDSCRCLRLMTDTNPEISMGSHAVRRINTSAGSQTVVPLRGIKQPGKKKVAMQLPHG